MKYYIQPWAHQLEAIEFSKQQKNMALFWEMGTGKTATTINILRHVYNSRESVLRTVIFAPIVVLKNWKKEFNEHAQIGDRYVIVAEGSGNQKAEVIQKCNDYNINRIIVLNYEAIQNKNLYAELTRYLSTGSSPKCMVLDESHRCKSPKSKRAKAIAKLADLCEYKYILSGTPVLNSPQDIFMQYRILDGGDEFGENFYVFQKKYFYDKNAGMPKHMHFPQWVPKPGVYAEFNRKINRKGLRQTKEQCLDLPPLIKETRNVELSKEQARAYKEMRDEFITYRNDEACVAQLAITKALRLQQIASGFIKTDDGNIHRFDRTPREKELKVLLEDLTPENKVIIWACFKENYKQIRELCDELGLKYAELHGEIKDKDEQAKVFREDADVKVMIANAQSAGLGVNLVEAGYSIYYSKNFSLEADLQSEARNHRGGSEKLHDKITRIDLVATDTLDEQVTEALARKQNVAEAILDWDI